MRQAQVGRCLIEQHGPAVEHVSVRIELAHQVGVDLRREADLKIPRSLVRAGQLQVRGHQVHHRRQRDALGSGPKTRVPGRSPTKNQPIVDRPGVAKVGVPFQVLKRAGGAAGSRRRHPGQVVVRGPAEFVGLHAGIAVRELTAERIVVTRERRAARRHAGRVAVLRQPDNGEAGRRLAVQVRNHQQARGGRRRHVRSARRGGRCRHVRSALRGQHAQRRSARLG